MYKCLHYKAVLFASLENADILHQEKEEGLEEHGILPHFKKVSS